ncbi:MAG: TadE/TadG family type IV pilus assembly protein [Caldilineaceae bacterium]
MARLIRWLRRTDKGQELIEFSISVLLLMGLAAGIADFGQAFQNYIIITNASREGARTAARAPCRPSDSTQRGVYRSQIVNAVIREAAGSNIAVGAGDITISPDPVSTGCAAAGNSLTVSVAHRYNMQMAGLVGVGSVNLRARTQMVFYGAD